MVQMWNNFRLGIRCTIYVLVGTFSSTYVDSYEQAEQP